MFKISSYNPDVLTCIANLSSDEVFTPPMLVNQMLDQLPTELWQDKAATFLDPGCKSGVFLREIAKRLDHGLETQIPDTQSRMNHIFKKQLYGLAITELTALLSRRSAYCSKTANGKYSICETFDNSQGNIHLKHVEHLWKNGKCEFCGANKVNYARGEERETHAYQFIHVDTPKEIFNMKFDVIIGNPPYQLDTGGTGRQATPIYQLFIQQAQKLKPRYLSMVIPSRWFAGGMGLDKFREAMLQDRSISHMVDYTNAKDCFPGVSISGGVNYFLWDREYDGPCKFTSIHNGRSNTLSRYLNEFPVLVRYNEAEQIILKIKALGESSLSEIVSAINPFGFPTSARGNKKRSKGGIKLHSSKGVGYIPKRQLTQGIELANKFKVMVSQTTSEHAGEPAKDGRFRLFSTVKVLPPGEICTFSYITAGGYDTAVEANNLKDYLLTKFARFMVLQAVSSIHLTKDKFLFLPVQNFKESWSDKKLYAKYGLSKDEIEFIDSMMRSMEKKDE
jgi:hypothetical protein